jgi:hypothetical protein
VISIYSSKYADITGTDYFQIGVKVRLVMVPKFDLNGDKMLNYIKLSYQGIALADGKTINVSGMEFIHMDGLLMCKKLKPL